MLAAFRLFSHCPGVFRPEPTGPFINNNDCDLTVVATIASQRARKRRCRGRLSQTSAKCSRECRLSATTTTQNVPILANSTLQVTFDNVLQVGIAALPGGSCSLPAGTMVTLAVRITSFFCVQRECVTQDNAQPTSLKPLAPIEIVARDKDATGFIGLANLSQSTTSNPVFLSATGHPARLVSILAYNRNDPSATGRQQQTLRLVATVLQKCARRGGSTRCLQFVDLPGGDAVQAVFLNVLRIDVLPGPNATGNMLGIQGSLDTFVCESCGHRNAIQYCLEQSNHPHSTSKLS